MSDKISQIYSELKPENIKASASKMPLRLTFDEFQIGNSQELA